MARGVNKVTLIGNLGQDPEIRHTPNGAAVCNVSLATTMSWKDRESGSTQERTEWHRLVFFGRLAEITTEYLRKGSQIYVEGRLQTRKWQDQSGGDRYTTEIIVSEMQMLGGRSSSAEGGYTDNRQTKPPEQGPGTAGGSTDSHDTFDDDIPF